MKSIQKKLNLTDIKRLVITPGEPAGIGPDLIVRIAQSSWPAELIAIADPQLLTDRAKLLKLPLKLIPFDLNNSRPHQPKTLKIMPVSLASHCQPGVLNVKNSPYVIECLKQAADHCLSKQVHALVTGPVHKSILNEAGIEFTGHTEFLAHYCKVKQVVMLFVTPTMKIALATVHVPLAKVPTTLSEQLLIDILQVLRQGLKQFFNCKNPKILVCGLNPHAGENGHLGQEEATLIEPALARLRAKKMDVIGPLPADTVFTEKYLKMADAILAMYHDQALPVVKFAGFNQAVNITLGLPIIRTSVDHGTALDLAGSMNADVGSLTEAIQLAIKMSAI